MLNSYNFVIYFCIKEVCQEEYYAGHQLMCDYKLGFQSVYVSMKIDYSGLIASSGLITD